MEQTLYTVGLNMVRGIGSARTRLLLNRFGTAEAAWHSSDHDLRACGLPQPVVQNLIALRADVDLEQVKTRLERMSVSVLVWDSPSYPHLLRNIENSPPVLYVRGHIDPEAEWAIAIVGTRRASDYGRSVARRLSTDLAQNQVTVVSGLARGIDTAGHRAALDAGGQTIAVLGCGIDHVYPPENRSLAAQIAEQGALVTEYPLGTPPESSNFPPRNRIISGLTLGTIVVEAGKRSGALITAAYALDQGRDVFAVPGNIYNRGSKGTNQLIRDGAHPVTDVRDVLESLNLNMLSDHQAAREILPANELEGKLLQYVSAEPTHVDQISQESELPVATISSALALMELKGMVRQAGGMKYVLAREKAAEYDVQAVSS